MSFTMDLERFCEATGAKMSLVRRKVALDMFRSVILKTPVDTGRARANWQCTTGSPAAGSTDGADKSGQQAIDSAASTIESSSDDQPVFLTNNLPYIEVLEDGSSTQAPTGMVATTVLSVKAMVDQAIADAKSET